MNTPLGKTNAEQIEYWNARAGETWAEFQEQLDRQIQPLGERAMQSLAPIPGERILDIGCGCGQTTLELSRRVQPGGEVVGVDISRPMLAVARARADRPASVRFLELDAQSADIAAATGVRAFNAAFSRFGVMFFSDPVAAFGNIRAALRPGGRLSFVCWRPLAENPWMFVPMQAATPLLPPMPVPTDPHAPGPFAFADVARVSRILRDAGFAPVTHESFDAHLTSGNVEETVKLTLRVGPLGAVLREHPQYRSRVHDAVRTALEPYARPEGVMLPAAVWIVSAHNP